MTAMTYLDLLNAAITESKVTLDPLDATSWANPPRTVMYNNFKRWINSAYTELFHHDEDWYFRKGRLNFTVYPRLQLYGVASTIAVGDHLVGQQSGVGFTIQEIKTFELAPDSTTSEVTVGVLFDSPKSASVVFGEGLNRDTPTAYTSIASVKGIGFYDLRNEVAYVEMIDKETVRAFPIPGSTYSYPYYTYPNKLAGLPMQVVRYDDFNPNYSQAVWADGIPNQVMEMPNGYYQFIPQPLNPFMIQFDYTKRIVPLVNATDIPSALPEQYHPYLYWQAVSEYSDFDRNAAVFARAQKHLQKYDFWLFRDQQKIPAFKLTNKW